MKTFATALTCLVMSICYAQDIDITLELFASGFSNPVNMKHAGDDRFFVVERSGIIKILNADGTTNTVPFIDINDRVTNAGGEEGLLAVAFHPNYNDNGYFYVNYIDNSGDTVISRFTRNSTTTADPSSELVLLNVSQPSFNHNGGDLHFGNDGYLYISLGDGGFGGDPQNHGQRLNSLLGKILRIDVDGNSAGNYGIPADNPFVGIAEALDEIWAYGLRNTWKFSFDRDTHDLWSADVGQNLIEEINKVPSTSNGGENYGWKCFEGSDVFQTSTDCNGITHETPIAEYAHNFGRCSISGGYVYRGTMQEALEGYYIFADFCTDEIGYVKENTSGGYDLEFILDTAGEGFSGFGEDVDGELFVMCLFTGNIYRIVQDVLSVDDVSLNEIKMFPNPAKNVLSFDVSSSNLQLGSVNIHDTQGKLVLQHDNFENQQTTISTASLTTGMYIVEIKASNGTKTIQKLVIQ